MAAGREIHRQDLSPVRWSLPLGEDGFVVRETGDTGPVLLGGSSQHPEYPKRERVIFLTEVDNWAGHWLVVSPKQLVDLRVSREERFPGDHLCEDAAKTPGVDAGAVEL